MIGWLLRDIWQSQSFVFRRATHVGGLTGETGKTSAWYVSAVGNVKRPATDRRVPAVLRFSLDSDADLAFDRDHPFQHRHRAA